MTSHQTEIDKFFSDSSDEVIDADAIDFDEEGAEAAAGYLFAVMASVASAPLNRSRSRVAPALVSRQRAGDESTAWGWTAGRHATRRDIGR